MTFIVNQYASLGGDKIKHKTVYKKMWNDEKGVSEIMGDVLILGLTITLFAGLSIIVYTLPTPDEGVYADFESSMQLVDGGGKINVTHIGGETLYGIYTKIYLHKNLNEEVRMLDTQGSDEDNPSYGIEGNKDWDPGEKWSYNYYGINSEDDLQISVIDTKSNSLIMKSILQGKGFNAPPIIMERRYDPEPAINDTEIRIYAKVIDPNGKEDLDMIFFNGSVLNPELEKILMDDSDGDSIFEAEVHITRGEGDYELMIFAVDEDGKMDSGRMCLTVKEASKPTIEFTVIQPNSVEVEQEFIVKALIIDENGDLNLSDVSVLPEQKFYDNSGSIETIFELADTIPNGGVFETNGNAPASEGVYDLTIEATDCTGFSSTKLISLAVIQDSAYGNGSFNDSIWAYIGPESLDFKKFYYTIDNPPNGSSTYHLAVYISENHIGDDCFLHLNVINHYYEDVYIDGNSRIRLLQIGGAASNKDINIVQNGTNFGDLVGTTPDGTWYRIPSCEDGDYFHGGEPVSLVFGPFDMSSAKTGDVFGSILVLTGSYDLESVQPENRYGQTLPFQAIVIA